MEQTSVRFLESGLVFFGHPTLSSEMLAPDLPLFELGVAKFQNPALYG
jgi:hypothetical protein